MIEAWALRVVTDTHISLIARQGKHAARSGDVGGRGTFPFLRTQAKDPKEIKRRVENAFIF
jgi:hypothetical protein